MKKQCFVIMPFGIEGTEDHARNLQIYRELIKPVVQKSGYHPIRADELEHFGNITRDIIELIFESDLVVADLSGKNANVFYELGVRHALLRYGTIPIIRQGENLPFDIANYRAIFYSTAFDGPEKFRDELLRRIRAFERNANRKSDNPVHDIIGDRLRTKDQRESVPLDRYDEQVQKASRLSAEITELKARLEVIEQTRSEQIKSLEKQLMMVESFRSEQVKALEHQLERADGLRLSMQQSEEQVKLMFIRIIATQINIMRLDTLTRLLYCLSPVAWLKRVI
jgi:hypothetical protein